MLLINISLIVRDIKILNTEYYYYSFQCSEELPTKKPISPNKHNTYI